VNKKEAKKTLLVRCGNAGATLARSGAKVFWFFFSKKNCFLLSLLRSLEQTKNRHREPGSCMARRTGPFLTPVSV
jgi:hypothetical protein